MPYWICLIVLLPSLAAAETFVVNSVDDGADATLNGECAAASGLCTLRAAIEEANALPGRDSIVFAIGVGAQTIIPASSLPIVTDPVVVDGWTQPGFQTVPLIVVDGQNLGDGFTVTAGGTTLRGLVIQNCDRNGIVLRGAGGNVIEGNYLGTDATGTLSAGNGRSGILIDDSPNNLVGGLSTAARNLISGNVGKGNGGGILISGSLASGNVIQGNYIGTDVSGMSYLGNDGRGVAISEAPNNLVGGAEAGARNLISGNRATGVRILGNGAEGNIVEGNWIGTNANGTFGIGNDRGVQTRASNNQFLRNRIIGNRNDGVAIVGGGTNTLVEGNVIAYNGYGPHADPLEQGFSGIAVFMGSANTFRSNLIFGNALLGIDLGVPYGVTLNDFGDVDTGANDLQNFPILTLATRIDSRVDVVGALNSHANSTFTVEFFASPQCSATGYGQGVYPLGQQAITTDTAGNAAIAVSLEYRIPVGWVISVTATGAAGDTSEFSPCVTVQ